jgi:Ca2+/Na+ antiporter
MAMNHLLPHVFLFLVGIEVAALLANQVYPVPKIVFIVLLCFFTFYGMLSTASWVQ